MFNVQNQKIQVNLSTETAHLPVYATTGSAGCDFFAAEDFIIPPTQIIAEMQETDVTFLAAMFEGVLSKLAYGEPIDPCEVSLSLAEAIRDAVQSTHYQFSIGKKSASTGVSFGIPINSNIELEIRSKSGLAFKKSILSFNGTVDEDYTQEIAILMYNLTSEPFEFKKGEKIAQGVFKQVIQPNFEMVDEINREVLPSIGRESNPTIKATKRESGFGSTGTTSDGKVKL